MDKQKLVEVADLLEILEKKLDDADMREDHNVIVKQGLKQINFVVVQSIGEIALDERVGKNARAQQTPNPD